MPVYGPTNENGHGLLLKRKDFKLRKTGKNGATVREVLNSANSGQSLHDKRSNILQKAKLL